MPKKTTKNLNLLTIRFPIPALVSILHRMSGVVLFVLMPFLVVAFCNSLTSPLLYKMTITQLSSFPFIAILYLMVWGLIHHLIAGTRHLLLDMQIGNDLIVARLSSQSVLVLSCVGTFLAVYLL
ncbi:MAG: succinate dehydrogenase, cytochrome b556 subunit [Nitrosomonadales bacterium]|jgi:succinate dehydrogenase / fumarate reductase, cytochrome b subunit|nr:succinate dehydrogenase, cytochrome b556 subunit [Nitrosomonadales bacterium]